MATTKKSNNQFEGITTEVLAPTVTDDSLDLDNLLGEFNPVIEAPIETEAVTFENVLEDTSSLLTPIGTSSIMTKSADPFEDLISDVGDLPEYMTWVVYGKNGTGKTTFGGSGKDTLVAEIEKDGTFSLRQMSGRAKKVAIKSWSDFEQLYWYLKRNPGKYKVITLDTLTRLQELCIRDVVLGEKAKDIELMDKDVIKVTLPQRGEIAQKMVYWLNAFNSLPIHKVWLCQEGSGAEDADVKDVDVYPDLSRKIRTYVCSDATVIGRMSIKMKDNGDGTETPVFRLIVAPSSKWLSKDRTQLLGKGIVSPKIDDLVQKIYNPVAQGN